MAGKRVVKRQPNSGLSMASKYIQFLELDAQMTQIKSRADELKRELLEWAVEHGQEDEKGNFYIELDEPVLVHGKKFTGFQRQRRVSITLDEERAEAFLLANNVPTRKFMSTMTYVDPDKVSRLYADDVLSEEEYDHLMNYKETFALYKVKG